MRFTPLSEDELNQRTLLAQGDGEFEVLDAVEKVSKVGNEMIELKLKVWDKHGKTSIIFDYLVSNAQWKLNHFFKAIGSPDSYLKGEMEAAALIGSSGLLKIEIKKDLKYGDQNKIADYFMKESPSSGKVKEMPIADFINEKDDSNIPF